MQDCSLRLCETYKILISYRIIYSPIRKLSTCILELSNATCIFTHKMPLIDPVTMSSLAPSSQSAPSKPSLPIDLLPTDLARLVSQAHPALLLAAYYIRFPALVANPVSTLLQSLLPVAAIQIVYAVICLPALGSGAKPVSKKVKLNAPKKGEQSQIGQKAFVCTLVFRIDSPF